MTPRKPLIAGNWKMNLGFDEAVNLMRTIVAGIVDIEDVDVLVAPPFTFLQAVGAAIGKAPIFLGAQNMHWDVSGAYTGEIAGNMLQDVGCTHVILGHSERRSLFGESSQFIAQKVKTAVDAGLIPVVCIGETLDQRESGKAFDVIEDQLNVSLNNFKVNQSMPVSAILAYEPVWAIGTGQTASPKQAQEVHRFIRGWLEKNFGSETAAQIRILYGGSVKPENVVELMSQSDIDGALIGGASLKADSFIKIIRYKR
jgi:triosephosphate isomerase